MRESITEVLVGAAVVAVAAGFLVYTAQATSWGAGASGEYQLTASFRSAEGVAVGTDVRMAGVKIGTVTDLSLNTDTYRADATFGLTADVPIPDDSAAVVASEGLLGGTFVEIVPGGSFDFFESGAEIEDTQGAVSVLQLLINFAAGGEEE